MIVLWLIVGDPAAFIETPPPALAVITFLVTVTVPAPPMSIAGRKSEQAGRPVTTLFWMVALEK